MINLHLFYLKITQQVHQLESEHQFKMDLIQMIQLKLHQQQQQQRWRSPQQQKVIRQRQSRSYCVSCFFRFLFVFLLFSDSCIIQFGSLFRHCCAFFSLHITSNKMLTNFFPNCVQCLTKV